MDDIIKLSVYVVSWWIYGEDHKRKTCQFLESAVGSLEEIIRGRPVSLCSQLVELWRRS